MTTPHDILQFWFGDDYAPGDGEPEFRKQWFVKDDDFDELIRERFGADLERAILGGYDGWADSARGRLALIIVLDQFSRNLFRGSPRAWCQDPMAMKLALEGIELGHDRQLGVVERAFFYLPLEHAEDPHMQELSVEKFGELRQEAPELAGGDGGFYDYAIQHRDVIERFGRYPHRNEVLCRPSTAEEEEYLSQPGSSF